jgi:hypothetical protein
MNKKRKIDCRECCFDAIPRPLGSYPSSPERFDADPESRHCCCTSAAVTECALTAGHPNTYYRCDEDPDFKCKYFVKRGSMKRIHSKAFISLFQDVYAQSLYYDEGNFRETLDNMWKNRYEVIQFAIPKLRKRKIEFSYSDRIKIGI